MKYEFILIEQVDRIRYITLHRAEKRNAFNHQLVSELKHAFIDAENAENTKVIILRANGDVFSAGADLQYLQSLQQNTYEDNWADSVHLKDLYLLMYTHKKVIIAQVEGHAIAGGCGLATVADFTFAVPEAQLGYTEVKIGFVPAQVMVFLLRKIGETRAKELLLTGKLISAQKALEYGIIYEVTPKESIANVVLEFAQRICNEASADSLRITKEMMGIVQDKTFADALEYAAQMNATARATTDCKKGIAAFLAKEKIVW